MKSARRSKNVRGTSASRQTESRRKGRSHNARQSDSDRPFVFATFAMTVDGKITTRKFAPVDFTSREDKAHLFRQRARADAVLIGHSTLKRDNVRLGLPAELREERIARGQTSSPIRVIVSNEGKIDKRLNIFQSDIAPILIFSTSRMPRRFQDALGQKAVLHLSDSGSVDLAEMLRNLRRKYNVRTLACEGGPTLFRAMLERGFIDELNLTIAPYLFGGADAPTLTGLSKDFLPASVHCSLVATRVLGEECFLTYRIRRQKSAPSRRRTR
jgi:5-amino-6-(5-phosphoribosylamino)uracil reductase